MTGKLYFWTVLGLMLLFTGWFVSFSADVEPLAGSQTRMGGFLERDFGVQAYYEEFETTLFVHGDSLEDYAGYFDVVVIGDSFTSNENPRVSWLNYFCRDNGMTALFLPIDSIDVAELIHHPVFTHRPPRALVVESTEPMALLRFKRLSLDKLQVPPLAPDSELPVTTRTYADRIASGRVRQTRRRTRADFKERMRVAGNYLLKSVEKALIGDRFNKVAVNTISCDFCFSNSRKGEFLIARRSLDPLAYDLDFEDEAVTRLTELKRVVESNGVTQFRTAVFPNKINVYKDYVTNEGLVSVYDLDWSEAETGLVPLLRDLRSAVDKKLPDVYLPNDHHTGPVGYKVASDAIGESLGWLRYKQAEVDVR
jgi:hypothetical protein